MSSPWKKQRLQDHFVVLCNELDVDRIVPVLKAERMLTTDEMEQLTNPHFTTRARREKLLLFIPRKGRAHFEKFAECLVWSGQTDLASKIGVPLRDIRPSPHPVPQVTSSLTVQQEQFQKMVEVMQGTLMAIQPHPYPIATHPLPLSTSSRPPFAYTPRTHLPPPNTPRYPTQETSPAGNTHQLPRQTNIPHPPPVGVHTPSPAHPVQRSCENVFILYCDDKEIPGDHSESVVDLAEFLTRTCGQTMKIHIDCYLRTPPGNWTRWTEQRITESDAVLFVCSPTLIKMLSERHTERPVPMKLGHFDAETVYNLIKAPKFVPIFLNNGNEQHHVPDLYSGLYRSWIPSKLLGTSRYWIDLEGLHRMVGETETDEEYHARLTHVLSNEQHRNKCIAPIAELLRSLQRTPGTQPPAPFPTPIEVPPAGHFVSPATCNTTANLAPQLECTRPELTFRDSELMMIAQRIPQDWQNVGIKLGIMYTTLENIRIKHAFDCQQAAMEMFGVWRRMKGEQATRTALKDALMCVGYGRVADDIFSKD